MKVIINYRIRITKEGSRTYITRRNGAVFYMAADETPLALSNLLGAHAAETRFALEDATSGNDAAGFLRTILAGIWQNNKAMMPKVDLL